MIPWIAIVTILAGINLVRATGRGLVVAIVSSLLLVTPVFSGGMRGTEIRALLLGAMLAGTTVALWRPLMYQRDSRRMSLGIVIFGLGCAAQFALPWGATPVAAKPWLWIAAILFLGEPSTRILRWGFGFMGKSPAGFNERYGRGEAIGVLERWITVIVAAQGEYSAIAFILAAKALVRHKRFETDPEFAEYFLVGTLASILIAIAVAEGLRHGFIAPTH